VISLITRVQYPDLYERMVKSAFGKSCGLDIEFISAPNPEGQPKIAPTYNRLAERAKGEYLIFLHDDIEFVEDGWDSRIVEFFAANPYDIGGVIGVDKYDGGLLTNAGHPHCFGKFVNRAGDEMKVNIYGRHYPGKQIVAADGMFLAVRADHFEREKFDEALDGLFFYDIDYCLRGKTGLLDVLVAHYKPKDRYGVYPPDMKTIEEYEPYFYAKWGISKAPEAGDTRSLCATISDYQEQGHDALWRMFEEKYLCPS